MTSRTLRITPGVAVQLLLVLVVIPFSPLYISGRWDWWEGWVSAAIFILGFVVSRALAVRRHPDILQERAGFMEHEDTKTWDKVLAPLVAFGSAFILVVAGSDARFGWSPGFPLAAKIVALALILLGYALGTYTLMENRFFSGTVRIQTERGHQVVSSGPYHWIRHPGYAGSIIAYLAMPVLLDSWWALVPAALSVVTIVIRTHLEDRTLQEELEGYDTYADHVPCRLLPGVW
ncbi:MAG: isoprenylcysteine carboxylmethyltransferase family protein [Anaerolineae bacterium]|nr:isoprenylcysteine carboxylmethyltransferase family protein [Anaerolineae bacterium]